MICLTNSSSLLSKVSDISSFDPISLSNYVILWTLTLTTISIIMISYKNGRHNLVFTGLVLLQVRNCFPMLDLGYQYRLDDSLKTTIFLITQPFIIIIIQVTIIFISSTKFALISSIIVSTLSTIGIFAIGGKGKSLSEVLITDKELPQFLMTIITNIIATLMNLHILNFMGKEVMKAWYVTNQLQSDLVKILEHFGEAIICKSNDGLGFHNEKGRYMLMKLYR